MNFSVKKCNHLLSQILHIQGDKVTHSQAQIECIILYYIQKQLQSFVFSFF